MTTHNPHLKHLARAKTCAKNIAAWLTRNKNEAGWKALAKIFVEVVQA